MSKGVTILGQHISLIRPERWKEPQVPEECVCPKQHTRAKTHKLTQAQKEEIAQEMGYTFVGEKDEK